VTGVEEERGEKAECMKVCMNSKPSNTGNETYLLFLLKRLRGKRDVLNLLQFHGA
jgi:hypothetical protein